MRRPTADENPQRLDFWTRLWSRSPRERCDVLGSHIGCLFGDPAIAFEDFGTERRQRRAAATGPTWGRCDDRLSKDLVHAVEQQPRPLVGHPHIAGSGRDRAGVPDAFKELRLARADPGTRLEHDADLDPRHQKIIALPWPHAKRIGQETKKGRRATAGLFESRRAGQTRRLAAVDILNGAA